MRKRDKIMVDSREAAQLLTLDHDLFQKLTEKGSIPRGVTLGPVVRWYVDDLKSLKRGEPARERAKFRIAR